jgi:prepilin-type N-terminal cleavage/methylation domain-containing protein
VRRRDRRGFTLVEVLIAIAVIAILTAMIFLGFRYVGASSRTNASHVSLQNLRGMLAEYEASGGRMDDLNAIYADLVDSKDVQTPLPAVPTPPLPSPLQGSVAEGGRERFGEGTIRTQRVLRRLMGVPSVKSAFNALPPDALLPVGVPTSGVSPSYLPGDEIAVGAGSGQTDYYVCKSKTKAAPPGGAWQHVGGPGEPPIHHTAILADGFHNPIWFAPQTGLGVEQTTIRGPNGVNLQSSGNGGYGQPNQTILPPGWMTKDIAGETIKLGRPFFASSGEDGDFSKGDDNVYSFEK